MLKHIITLIWNKKRSNILLFLEIFFSFLILFAVFTFVVVQMRMYSSPLGFDTKNIWVAQLTIEEDADSTAIAQMKPLLLREVEALPEVISASYTGSIVPFSGSTWQTSNDENGFEFESRFLINDENYAETAGLNIVEGRWFTKEDANARYVPIVITKQMQDKYYGDKNCIDSLLITDDDGDFGDRNKIVGVIDHYKYLGEFEEEYNCTFVYYPPTSKDTPAMNIRVVEGSGAEVEEKINKVITGITKKGNFVIKDLEKERIRRSKEVWIPMIAMLCISGFLVINVALGLFGILWYNISKRKSEIGLRRTLGASQGNISFQFITEILMVTLFGILVGTFFAIQLPLLKLFEFDNINYYYAMLFASALIFLIVLLCAFYPSRQAARINPAIALHEE